MHSREFLPGLRFFAGEAEEKGEIEEEGGGGGRREETEGERREEVRSNQIELVFPLLCLRKKKEGRMSESKDTKEERAVEIFKMKKLIKSLNNARG